MRTPKDFHECDQKIKISWEQMHKTEKQIYNISINKSIIVSARFSDGN